MIFYNNNYTELYHHGILGQKWGVRRYQNPDGTLTAEGRRRYKVDSNGNYKRITDKEIKSDRANYVKNYKDEERARLEKKVKDLDDEINRQYKEHGGYDMDLEYSFLDAEDELSSYLADVGHNYILNKYGDARINEMQTRNNIKVGAAIVGSFAAVYAPVVVKAGIDAAVEKRNEKKPKVTQVKWEDMSREDRFKEREERKNMRQR